MKKRPSTPWQGGSGHRHNYPGDPAHHEILCGKDQKYRMGGSKEEMAMVAGFAGGLGLSGSGCGALAAAVWKNALNHNRKETDYEMQCDKICGQRFEIIAEHTEFVKYGGCKKLIKVLAETKLNA